MRQFQLDRRQFDSAPGHHAEITREFAVLGGPLRAGFGHRVSTVRHASETLRPSASAPSHRHSWRQLKPLIATSLSKERGRALLLSERAGVLDPDDPLVLTARSAVHTMRPASSIMPARSLPASSPLIRPSSGDGSVAAGTMHSGANLRLLSPISSVPIALRRARIPIV